MRLAILALGLSGLAGPALADLVCPTELTCADAACRAADPADEEGATYVRDPLGPASELYLGDGIWVPAARAEDRGALVWSATAPSGEAVVLAVRREGGAYLLTRREPGPDGRVWSATGRCADRP
ncbi:MAG: hypothetical protein IT542_01310 [Rubellimicrobium sp.]|nr:hypothetical protein [Rubellimicrobium sp.]